MNIVVCCKAVPGLVTDLKIAADGKAIQYQGQLLAINECDEYGLEEALALKRSHGGQILRHGRILVLGPHACHDEVGTVGP